MKAFLPLKFNDPAPDLEVITGSGGHLQLSSLWSEKPVVLAFTRHYGCPQCKELLDELSLVQADLGRHGLALAVITQGDAAATLAFCAQYAPNVVCLSDPQRQVYTAFGLRRGNLFQTLFSPAVWRANARAKKKGYSPQMPPKGQDALLMSGLFIIGQDGRIRLPYYYDNIADHPPVSLLLEGFLGTSWDQPLDAPIKPSHH
jgi:peroxiredoxin